MTSGQILTGKTAVVTGASSGIGRAIAERLGGAGAHVYLAGRTPDAMEASKARIEENGGKATPVWPTFAMFPRCRTWWSARLAKRADSTSW